MPVTETARKRDDIRRWCSLVLSVTRARADARRGGRGDTSRVTLGLIESSRSKDLDLRAGCLARPLVGLPVEIVEERGVFRHRPG